VLVKRLPDGEDEIEIGWHFHPDSWGEGLASEVAGALLACGFEEGLDEVWAVTQLDKHRSVAVCRRIGMRNRPLVSPAEPDVLGRRARRPTAIAGARLGRPAVIRLA